MDTSPQGWGAVCLHLSCQGCWSIQDQNRHINYLDLSGLLYSPRVMTHSARDVCLDPHGQHSYPLLYQEIGIHQVLAKCALTWTTQLPSFISRNREAPSPGQMCPDLEIAFMVLQHGITLSTQHLPGKVNILADTLSGSTLVLSAEWSMHPGVFQSLCSQGGTPLVDMFTI